MLYYYIMDLPKDYFTGEPIFELEEPLERLNTMLMRQLPDQQISDLDDRSENLGVLFNRIKPAELQTITGFIDRDPKQRIKSSSVRDLNDKFDFNMDSSDPNFIFRGDLKTRNNVDLIRQGNLSFAKERDLFVVPPPKDIQQSILDILEKK